MSPTTSANRQFIDDDRDHFFAPPRPAATPIPMNTTEKTKTRRQRAARATFMRRSYSIYKHMTTRIRGRPYETELPFDIEELRNKILAALSAACPYCAAPLTAKNFSADHMTPLNRADEIVNISWLARLDNIAVCCAPCQRLKGALDQEEYRRLLALLATFDSVAQRDVKRRLKAGGAVVRCGIATF